MSIFWEKIIRPFMFRLDAERAHELGMAALKLGLGSFAGSAQPMSQNSCGPVERFGLTFANPIGLAAGFDKNGIVVNRIADLGFGFVEVGTVTASSQPGNPKPRMFRLPEDKALINRLGFNNQGAAAIAERLGKIRRKCIVGVNIGKNKDVPNEDAAANYLASFDLVHPVADYIAVNISSPNTPNLRELQRAENFEGLLTTLQKRNRELGTKPLLVKIAPDLSESELESIVGVCLDKSIDGIIATNTTIERTGLLTPNVENFGSGGLSGKPLTERSTQLISQVYRLAAGRLPIIGVGGVFTAEDAFAKIAAGACLVQAYTGFVYRGPAFAVEIVNGLSELLAKHGFDDLDQAVGSTHSD